MEKATFAAGCFWGIEDTFRHLAGVKDTAVGYTGGHREHPTYKQVCSGGTGHAEAVQVEYDPNEISYEKLLEVFWKIHDPTQIDRQGPDIGDQYRSAIFYHTPEQEEAARKSLKEQGETGRFNRPIATRIEPARTFWMAEDYHQQYMEKRGMSGMRCH